MKFLSFIFPTFLSLSVAATDTTPILGVWETQAQEDEDRTARVEITPCVSSSEKLCGKIVWLQEPIDPETKQPKLDTHNPDPTLRSRPIMGLEMMSNFERVDNRTYDNGTIYSPRTGKTYASSVYLTDEDVLEVTGHVFIFSKTQKWKRISKK